ncbi:hypothetical protein Tcan_06447 [Toxocara canis]|uniref:Uncharacterized protein n=1 Tax=Toxocara canis TaxID=6265 RepID=A0A0B2VNQ7_TOXCA|nr:hypothetical protein Tcan_06447 [Toxocara canis]
MIGYPAEDSQTCVSDVEGPSKVEVIDICEKAPQPNRTFRCAKRITPKTSVVAPMLKTFRERRSPGHVENILKQHEAKQSGAIVEWTEAQLINPILSMIEAHKNCPFLVRNRDGSFSVDPKHRLHGDGASAQSASDNLIAVYVKPFVEAHRQLEALVAFTARANTNSKMVEILQELVIKFLSEHALAVSRRYTDRSLCVQMLAHSLRNELRALSTVYDALSNVFDADIWTYETVDKFIERFLRLTLYAELQTTLVKRIVCRLQVVIFSVFKRYFNSIFSNGTVEETFADEFIFYNVQGDASNELGVRATACSFWSPQLISNVLAGARDAKRLRDRCTTKRPPKFSTYFMRFLYGKDDVDFVSASRIILSAERSAARCARDNAMQLFAFVRQNGALDKVAREIELIFTGFAVRELAFDLFGATRDAPVSSIVLSFYNSLQMSGFSEERCNMWSVRCGDGTLEQLYITPKLQSLMAKKMPFVLESSTVIEAHEHLMSLNSQLDHLISEEGCARGLVHDAVSKLCGLADELDARLGNDLCKDSYLEDMLKMVLRERELLIGLGRAMEGTIFNVLQLFLWN